MISNGGNFERGGIVGGSDPVGDRCDIPSRSAEIPPTIVPDARLGQTNVKDTHKAGLLAILRPSAAPDGESTAWAAR